MSDEELLRNRVHVLQAQLDDTAAQRDSLRAALEQALFHIDNHDHTAQDCGPVSIARQALTSSEKDREPMVMQQLQQTTSSDATLRGTSSEKETSE